MLVSDKNHQRIGALGKLVWMKLFGEYNKENSLQLNSFLRRILKLSPESIFRTFGRKNIENWLLN
jgi:hypothetical protein